MPFAKPAALRSFFASSTLNLRYLALSPKSLLSGSSQYGPQPATIGEFSFTSESSPAAAKASALLIAPWKASRSISIENAWRTRASLKGELPS